MSELEQLIELDFSQLNMAQFKRMLKYITKDTGPNKNTMLLVVNAKILAEIYREVATP